MMWEMTLSWIFTQLEIFLGPGTRTGHKAWSQGSKQGEKVWTDFVWEIVLHEHALVSRSIIVKKFDTMQASV